MPTTRRGGRSRVLREGPWVTIEATMRGLNQVTSRLDPDVLFKSVRTSMTEVLNDLKQDMQYATPAASYEAYEGYRVKIEGTSVRNLNGRVYNIMPYFRILEYGRRPGARMPPAGPLLEWAATVGADFDHTNIFVLQRRIQKHGLPAHHIMRNALRRQKPHFAVVFMRRIMQDWNNPSVSYTPD